MAKKALVVDHVSMKFNLSEEKVDSIKEYIIRLIRGNLKYNEFWALRDVSFTLNAGDRLGILGLNGAGKSTLLKVIAGVFKPTEGVVRRYGKVVLFWSLAQVLTNSTRDGKISICTGRCSVTAGSILTKNLRRS